VNSPRAPQPRAHPGAWRRGVAALLLIAGAGSLQRSSTSQWGVGTPTAGGRIEVSPIGVARTDSVGGQQLCRWWPVSGEPSLCRAPATARAQTAVERLRLGYPFLQAGFWSGMIALFLVVLRIPRRRSMRVAATLITAALGLAGTLCVVGYAPDALEVLRGIPVHFRLTGAVLAWFGTAAATASGLLQLPED